jgi:hypothetical protein
VLEWFDTADLENPALLAKFGTAEFINPAISRFISAAYGSPTSY